MTGFGDAGERVEVVEPEYPDDEIPVRDEAEADRHERLSALIAWLCHGRDAQSAGYMVLTLGYLMKVPGSPENLRDLADRMGVPLTKAWRLKQTLRAFIGDLGRG